VTSHPNPTLPQLEGGRFVTDGGMETDLIFHHGVELPHFAVFPLVLRTEGRALLERYYADYAGIARRVGAGLMLESPTWRANPDWGERLGYPPRSLDDVNRRAIEWLAQLRRHTRRPSATC
jgi:S-methylmethionine-dependent homocysteine/selenocysteine methylase